MIEARNTNTSIPPDLKNKNLGKEELKKYTVLDNEQENETLSREEVSHLLTTEFRFNPKARKALLDKLFETETSYTIEELIEILDVDNSDTLNLQDVQVSYYRKDHLWGDLGIDMSNVRQGKTGDCYFLSTIIALAGTEEGKDILDKAVDTDSHGNFFIIFPADPTKEYVITKAEIDAARDPKQRADGKKLSDGNHLMTALELAYEKFIADHPSHAASSQGALEAGTSRDISVLFGLDITTFGGADMTKPIEAKRQKIYEMEEQNDGLTCGFKKPDTLESIEGTPLIASHTYVISNIDRTTGIVTLLNPHDINKPLTIHIDNLLNCPSMIVSGIDADSDEAVDKEIEELGNSYLNQIGYGGRLMMEGGRIIANPKHQPPVGAGEINEAQRIYDEYIATPDADKPAKLEEIQNTNDDAGNNYLNQIGYQGRLMMEGGKIIANPNCHPPVGASEINEAQRIYDAYIATPDADKPAKLKET